MTFFDGLNSPKFDFTQNRSGGKIIKFQQSQALTLRIIKRPENSNARVREKKRHLPKIFY